MQFGRRIWNWLRHRGRTAARRTTAARQSVHHVIILDGTQSSLDPGYETHAGTTYKLLLEASARTPLSLYYEAGIQWQDWRRTGDVAFGKGINRQIRRAYGYLSSRYRPGDKIFLIGYSRGAFAVRSLAGVIDRIGLLRADAALERNVLFAYRHYQDAPDSDAARAFCAAHCHTDIEIEMIGVWDTVAALGIRLPLLWRLTENAHAFHNHQLSSVVRHGYHALALDERRAAFAPVMWHSMEDWSGALEQMWFRGTHGDIGGQIDGEDASRPLANIPLVWLLEKAEALGLPFPDGWRARFPCDPEAPSVGMDRGWGRLFIDRKDRVVGLDPSEKIHPTAQLRGVSTPMEPGGLGEGA